MSANNYPRVFLNKNEEKEILQGMPWVFDNEISYFKHRADEKSEWKNQTLAECSLANGSIVEVFSKAGGFLGTGVFNKNSKITVRLIGNEHADLIMADTFAYYEKKVFDAYNMRQLYYSAQDSYRLIFGEADLIPGFICERFCDESGKVILLIQFLSMSCDIFRKEILAALIKCAKPDAIFERSDGAVRQKEGLDEVVGWVSLKEDGFPVDGPSTPSTGSGTAGTPDNADGKITIVENGIKLGVDIVNGQKTGYFLDQKFNRKAAARFCHGKRVLDTFTHTGAFGLNAFKAGAREVISVDISPEAVEMVNHNIELNKAGEKMKAVCADVFDLLKQYEAAEEKFDVIILDPPAFTKSAKAIEKAYGGYKEINLRAMRLLNKGGILITCSCSYFMESKMFCDMLMHAAMDSHKKIQILEKFGAGPDHPVLLGYPKSEYLKCVVCRVL
ncbi:MAG: class I SAM-dependent rRNA methyltransferase [Treponema sp.]|nr:class I SAM-dependent rRNA methyltransferase [Treponema sp.]